MRMLAWILLAGSPFVTPQARRSAWPQAVPAAAAPLRPVGTVEELMVQIIYP